MIAAAMAASSAREMVFVTPTPLGFTYWDTCKQGWSTPDPVSFPLLFYFSCFLRLPSACQSCTLRIRFGLELC
jgi:hypothetical protein